MPWFKKPEYAVVKPTGSSVEIPSGLWSRCEGCHQLIYNKELAQNLKVCPKCNYHFRLSAYEWINLLLEQETFSEYDRHMESADPLNFHAARKYKERLKEAQEKTKLKEAVVTGEGFLGKYQVGIGALDASFILGSMGSVVGEKIARLVEKVIAGKMSLIMISASGGARMDEGLLSLMQMAKTSAAIARLHQAGLLYVSLLTNPTTGGVAASFASLGDIIISEPRALIGFAGQRVIEQTIRQKLPAHFQKAEFLLERGFVDMILERNDLRQTLIKILEILS